MRLWVLARVEGVGGFGSARRGFCGMGFSVGVCTRMQEETSMTWMILCRAP